LPEIFRAQLTNPVQKNYWLNLCVIALGICDKKASVFPPTVFTRQAMSTTFSYLWTAISNIGVKQQYPFVENVKIKLLNQIVLIGWLGEIILLAIAPISPSPWEYAGQVIAFVLIQGFIILLHHHGKIKFARYFSSFITPVGTTLMILNAGERFGGGYLFLLSIFMTYILYSDQIRIRNLIIGGNIILYIVSACISIYFPNSKQVSNTLDEHILFVMCIFGIGLVIMLYQKEIQKNQSRRLDLIDELKEKNDQLSKSNAELERFTYIASHDLKSPLRTMINFLGVMERNIDQEDYHNLDKPLNHVKTGAHQMHYVVTDILEYSSINNVPLEKKALSLTEIVEKVITNLQLEIEEKGAVIAYSALPAITANDIEFITLFQNLIENGLKYNLSSHPQISVSTEYMEDFFLLKFRDNGIGIDNKYHNQIFELFKRLHSSSDFKGTGLGLGICSKIVKSYGGEIWVESTPEEGSVFIIQLPIDLITVIHKKTTQREISEKIMMD
jgi:signal transduction histidine kinase